MKILFLFISINLLSIPILAQSNLTEKTEQTSEAWSLAQFSGASHSFYEALEIFHDKNGDTSFEFVKENDQLFGNNNTADNFQANQVYWAKLVLRGHPQKTANYLFGFSSQKTEFNWLGNYDIRGWLFNDVWLIHQNGNIEQQRTGFGLSKAEKSVPSVANLVQFEIGQNEEVILYARFKGAMTKLNERPQRISLLLLNDEVFPTLLEGYPFKGHFSYIYPTYPLRFNLIRNHEFHLDQTGKATIDDIATNWKQLAWKDYYNTSHKVNQVYWLKTSFYGSSTFYGEQFLSIQAPIFAFDYVDAYISDRKGTYQHQQTGKQIPLKEQSYKFWLNLIQLEISPTDTFDLFVRLEGADSRFLTQRIELFHYDKSTLFPEQVNEAWKNGIFYGILAVQCLFFLLLFFVEKEIIHLYFVWIVLGLFLALGFNSDNFSIFASFPDWRNLHFPLQFLGYFLATFGMLKFTETYFNYSKDSFFSKKLIPTYFLLSLLVHLNAYFRIKISPTANSFEEFSFLLLLIFIVLSPILSLVMALLSKRQKTVSIKFFLLAFLPVSLVVLFQIGSNIGNNFLDIGYLAPVYKMYDLLKGAILLMLTLLALSSGFRTNRLKAEKENALKKNLADQKQINKAISRFVPNEFLNALNKSSITEVTLGDHIEKDVTVFFSDIRGYTMLSEQMSPEENFQFVNAYNARMGPIIQRNNGFVNQYLGDGIMAIFPDSATDALRAAIQMQQSIYDYNNQRVSENRKPLKVGMGMHTGSLIMGITGDVNRLDAATISDSVNSAARIESLSKHYGASILLSEICLDQLDNPNEFHLRYLGQVQVKGKQKPLKIYECFDGDRPEIFDLKLKTLSKFKTGIQHYFNQLFPQAKVDFEAIVQQNPKDKTAVFFLNKIIEIEKTGISKDWTGIEMMEKK